MNHHRSENTDHSPEWVTTVSDTVVATSDDVVTMQRTGAPEWLVERIQSLT